MAHPSGRYRPAVRTGDRAGRVGQSGGDSGRVGVDEVIRPAIRPALLRVRLAWASAAGRCWATARLPVAAAAPLVRPSHRAAAPVAAAVGTGAAGSGGRGVEGWAATAVASTMGEGGRERPGRGPGRRSG